MTQPHSSRTRRLTLLALLTAVSLIMFVIELHIPSPVPIPGIKLGLANIVTVFAVYTCKAGEAASVFAARIILGAVFAGTPVTLLFSACGGLLCLIGMLLIRRFTDIGSIVLASIAGAVLHNLGQTAAAVFVMKTTAVLAYLPYLCFAGCIAGAFTGLCAYLVIRRLRRSGAERLMQETEQERKRRRDKNDF